MRRVILLAGFILLFTGCSSSSVRPELTPVEENRLAQDRGECSEKANQSARGLSKGGITWERKRNEIYDYCMKSKGWDLK